MSLLTLFAIGMFLLESLVAIYLNLWLPVMLSRQGWGCGSDRDCFSGKGPPSVCGERSGMGTLDSCYLWLAEGRAQEVEGEMADTGSEAVERARDG